MPPMPHSETPETGRAITAGNAVNASLKKKQLLLVPQTATVTAGNAANGSLRNP